MKGVFKANMLRNIIITYIAAASEGNLSAIPYENEYNAPSTNYNCFRRHNFSHKNILSHVGNLIVKPFPKPFPLL